MGECSYEIGNYAATNQVEYLKQVLRTTGLNEERLRIDYCSSAEGTRFANIVKEMTETISKLGPNPLRKVTSVAE